MSKVSFNLAFEVLDSVCARCIENPYTIVGHGDRGIIWQKRQILDTKSAIVASLARVDSHLRLQNLVLFAPPLDVLSDLTVLWSQNVAIDVYIGADDAHSQAILESFASFCVVRFYKNVSFSNLSHKISY